MRGVNNIITKLNEFFLPALNRLQGLILGKVDRLF